MGGATHVSASFQFQIQPEIPVSIVCVVLAPVISPHVHVQFHVHPAGVVADGAAIVDGAGGDCVTAGSLPVAGGALSVVGVTGCCD
jgi:hypothetical protein